MQAGNLDKRIKIQGETLTEDSFGGVVESFNDLSTVWAEVAYGSGGERRVGAAQEQANLPVTVTVRHSTLTSIITPGAHRLHFDGKEWDIESVAPGQGRPSTIIIIARARV